MISFTGRISAIGCYKDKKSERALPELLKNYRGRLDWRDLSGTVIENCKLEAIDKVRSTFTINHLHAMAKCNGNTTHPTV